RRQRGRRGGHEYNYKHYINNNKQLFHGILAASQRGWSMGRPLVGGPALKITRREAMAAGLALFPGALAAQESDKWKIHEWGTFTALQDERGKPLGWINTEDEPVPPFCHRLSKNLLVPVDDLSPGFFKDAPRCHPDVILRLETPVVYFHPPKSATLPAKVDLRVDFRGGWLTEYYPDGKVDAPGLQNQRF